MDLEAFGHLVDQHLLYPLLGAKTCLFRYDHV